MDRVRGKRSTGLYSGANSRTVLVSASKSIQTILTFTKRGRDILAVGFWVWEYSETSVSTDITVPIIYIQLVSAQCHNFPNRELVRLCI